MRRRDLLGLLPFAIGIGPGQAAARSPMPPDDMQRHAVTARSALNQQTSGRLAVRLSPLNVWLTGRMHWRAWSLGAPHLLSSSEGALCPAPIRDNAVVWSPTHEPDRAMQPPALHTG